MKPEAQRIKIAEACGWRAVREKDGWWNISPDGKRIAALHGSLHGFPDYLNDLNAMHEAEKVLLTNCPASRWETYDNHLADACGGFARAHATAAQRSEAFLRTLGLGEDDK